MIQDNQDVDMKFEEDLSKIPKSKLTQDDFYTMSLIGKGSYGKVLLVKKNDDNKIYAMKILKKDQMKKRNQIEHVKTERRILEIIDHPFIIKLRYAFQNEKKLYLVTDYCAGGELFYHIQRVERFNEEAVKFYASQIVLAISHLHENNIIYRDLKPENVLIDRDGYIKITDFGLSKQGIIDNHSAHSFCGTPEYLAPEVIDNLGHGKAVDWWSLGAIVFEMLTGLPPFYSKDRDKLFKNIKAGAIKYPNYLSKDALSLLQSLFQKDPDKRLGSGENGLQNLMSHPFFKNIDWNAIYNKKIKPPFTPKFNTEADIVKYIDREFLEADPNSYNPTNSTPHSVDVYNSFSYNTEELVKKNDAGNDM